MKKLSENHHRAFTAIGVTVEKKLVDMELSLQKARMPPTAFLSFTDDLGENEKESVEGHIAEIRGLLRDFRDRFGLARDERKIKREINVTASFLWEDVAGIKGKKMDAYGHLDAAVKDELSGYIRRITRIVEEIVAETL